jgi:phospholipid/cholesterol/gamma-HCH transport system substrate-binding protein
MKKSYLELWVGVFVALVMVCLVISILFFGNQNRWAKGYDILVHFSFTNGVEVGAPVRFSGVSIGRVKAIRIMNNGSTVELRLFINKGVVLREDVSIFVNTLGIMGEKYIEFMGGSSDARIIQKGWAPIIGTSPIAVNNITQMAEEITKDLKSLIKNLQAVFGDPQTQQNLREIFKNVKEMTAEFGSFSKTMNGILETNEEDIHEIIGQMNIAVAGMGKNMVTFDELIQGVKEGKGLLGQILTDEDLYKEMKDLMADIKAHPWKLLIKQRKRKIVEIKTNISSRKR